MLARDLSSIQMHFNVHILFMGTSSNDLIFFRSFSLNQAGPLDISEHHKLCLLHDFSSLAASTWNPLPSQVLSPISACKFSPLCGFLWGTLYLKSVLFFLLSPKLLKLLWAYSSWPSSTVIALSSPVPHRALSVFLNTIGMFSKNAIIVFYGWAKQQQREDCQR